MTDVRCPQCSAHVAAEAQWCGQCYTSLAKAPVKPSRPPLSAPVALQVLADEAPGAVALLTDAPPPGSIPPPPGTIPPPPPAPPGKARLKVGKQPWPCVRCETVNKYEDNTCVACGKGFLDGLAEDALALPVLGRIDATSRSGKIKIGVAFSVAFSVVLVIVFTIGGLIVG